MFLRQHSQKIIAFLCPLIIASITSPCLAETAAYELLNGKQGIHQYQVNSFMRNQHGIILGVIWDNGIESTYYLGRSGDLKVDDGSSGSWTYDSLRDLLILNVSQVGTFVFDMGSDSYQSRYYWDEPAAGCRDVLTGEFVSGHLCR